MAAIKKDRRGDIMAAAVKVFSEKGYQGTTMEDIAVEAGMGKGTLYLYFPSKDDLVKEILFFGLNVVHDGFVEIARGPGSARERLRAMAFMKMGLASENTNLVRLILEGAGGLGQDFNRILMDASDRMLEVIASVLDSGVSSGEIRPVNGDIFSKVFLGALYSVAGSVLKGDLALEPGQAADQVIGILFDGIAQTG